MSLTPLRCRRSPFYHPRFHFCPSRFNWTGLSPKVSSQFHSTGRITSSIFFKDKYEVCGDSRFVCWGDDILEAESRHFSVKPYDLCPSAGALDRKAIGCGSCCTPRPSSLHTHFSFLPPLLDSITAPSILLGWGVFFFNIFL